MSRSKKIGDRGKYRVMSIVLYPESQLSVIEYIQANWSCAWALHDKDRWQNEDFADYVKEHGSNPDWNVDDLKKPHVHFLIRFVNQRSLSGVARELSQVGNSSVPTGAVHSVDNERGAFEYLWHKDREDKYKYDSSIVCVHDYDAPDDNTPSYLSEKAQAAKIREMPVDLVSLDSQLQWCLENDCYECFSSKYSMWRDWRAERSSVLAARDRQKHFDDYANASMYGCGNVVIDGTSMRRLSGSVPFEDSNI